MNTITENTPLQAADWVGEEPATDNRKIEREQVKLEKRLCREVGRAVLELDMTGYPVVVFKNAAHGGLSVVYRRPDGNVGWIVPERTGRAGKTNGHR